METCRNIELLLADYSAGDLDTGQKADVDGHLSACADCRAELARELDLRHTLAGLPQATCPDRVTTAILAAIDAEPVAAPQRHWLSRGRAYIGLAAAVLALAVLLPRGLDLARGPAEPTYTAQEIRTARKGATTALLLATQVIDRGERETARRLGESVPESLTRSLKAITAQGEGGQG